MRIEPAPIITQERALDTSGMLKTIIITTIIAITVLELLGTVLSPIYFTRWIAILLFVDATGLLALMVLARNRAKLAGIFFMTSLWLLLTILTWTSGGLSEPTANCFPLLVLAAGLIMGEHAGKAMGVVCAATGLVLALADELGALPLSSIQNSPLGLWVAFTLNIILIISLQHMAARVINEASDRARREERLRQSVEEKNRQWAAIVEASEDAIIGASLDGTIQSWNGGAARLYGYPAERVIGSSLEMLAAPGRRGEMTAMFERTRDGQRVTNHETAHRTQAGTILHVSLNISPVSGDQAGKVAIAFVARNITERKAAEDKLTQISRRLRLAAETSGFGVWEWNLKSNQLIWDERMFQIYGLPPQAGPLPYARWSERVSAEDLCKVETILGRAIKEKSRVEYDFRILTRGNERRFIRATAAVLTDANGAATQMIGVNIDVTEHTQAENALRFSLNELRDAHQRITFQVNKMPLGYIVWDRELKVIEWNRMAERIFGWTEEQAKGRSGYDLIVPPQARAIVERIWNDIISGGSFGEHAVNENVSRNGTKLVCEWFNAPLRDAQGRIIGCLSMINDITDRKLVEAAKSSLEAQLRQSQKIQALGTLAGGIAHDFNNILAAISGNVELALRRTSSTEPVHRNLVQISKAQSRAAELVKQILTFTSCQESKREIIDVEPVVSEAVGLLESSLPAMISVTSSIEPELPRILADPSQLRQVITNLGANAAQAMSEDGGSLSIRLEQLRMDGELLSSKALIKPGNYLCLSVIDTGCGMTADTVERIFEPFFTTKSNGERSGLGLSVVHGIMESHGGAIDVQSVPGRGTTFKLFFPVSEEAESRRWDVDYSEKDLSGHGETIMVVDDEESITQLSCDLLERHGYKPRGFGSPLEALEAFTADPGAIDLVVTDYAMPEMNGADLSRRLLELRPDLPVVMASGYLRREDLHKVRDSGIRQLLLKPDSVHELIAVIYRTLRDAARERQSAVEQTRPQIQPQV